MMACWRKDVTVAPPEYAHGTAINNEIDRFTLAIDAIKRTPTLQKIGAHATEKFRNLKIAALNYAHENGIDQPSVCDFIWPL
jgi:xylulose-5-phosphate/fructose-6-phosphate phosphoketolase